MSNTGIKDRDNIFERQMINLVLFVIISCLNGTQVKLLRKHVENSHSA